MAKYRKRPVVIDAIKWTGYNTIEINDFCGDNWRISGDYAPHLPVLRIKTLEGDHIATIGDYIIKGIKGEFYPCKPDIFELTYDAE